MDKTAVSVGAGITILAFIVFGLGYLACAITTDSAVNIAKEAVPTEISLTAEDMRQIRSDLNKISLDMPTEISIKEADLNKIREDIEFYSFIGGECERRGQVPRRLIVDGVEYTLLACVDAPEQQAVR